MTITLQPAVGLLERAVAYTRGALVEVTPAALAHPTPCHGWDLARLLAHMDDALDAFTEASRGVVALTAAPDPLADALVLDRIRLKACTLLGSWAGLGESDDAPATIALGGMVLPTGLLVQAGALEISVHGWDVGESTGHPSPLPEDLAARLLPVATLLVGPEDRAGRFGPPLPVRPGASYADRLLRFLGRQP